MYILPAFGIIRALIFVHCGMRSHPHSGQMYIFSIVVAFLLTIVFFYAVDGVAEQIAHALQPPEAHMAIDAVLHPCGSQLVP